MVIIIGAGLSGLIAANILTRQYRLPVKVLEAQPELPNNHAALLRFRSDLVSKAVGIPFRRVRVEKAIWHEGGFVPSDIRVSNLYSYKVSDRVEPRSIIDTSPGERWIAPPDFIARLAEGLDIEFGKNIGLADIPYAKGPVISTVPMRAMMAAVTWPHDPEHFRALPIWTVRATLPRWVDVYQTIYSPSPSERVYRASITGREMILEGRWSLNSLTNELPRAEVSHWLPRFGIDEEAKWVTGLSCPAPHEVHQPFGKIVSAPEPERRAFMLSLTERRNIYSLGRFATWRQILLDDVVQDVERIAGWITARDNYRRKLEM